MKAILLAIIGLVLGGLIGAITGAWVFDTLWGTDSQMTWQQSPD